jgi:hypothetical protein
VVRGLGSRLALAGSDDHRVRACGCAASPKSAKRYEERCAQPQAGIGEERLGSGGGLVRFTLSDRMNARRTAVRLWKVLSAYAASRRSSSSVTLMVINLFAMVIEIVYSEVIYKGAVAALRRGSLRRHLHRGGCALAKVKLACGSTKANGRVCWRLLLLCRADDATCRWCPHGWL